MEENSASQLALNVFFDGKERSVESGNKTPELKKIKAEKGSLPPLMQYYVDTKEKYPEHILLCQIGDFYEIFFEDAKIVSDVLGIRLTARNKEQENPIPMCGVPIHAIDNYLPKLVNAGLSCMLISQADGDSGQKGAVKREISRVITPGVRYEGDGLEQTKFNYLATACLGSRGTGAISYVDVSTGNYRLSEVENAEELIDLLSKINPSELILPSLMYDIPLANNLDWVRSVKKFCAQKAIHLVFRPFAKTSREQALTRMEKLFAGCDQEKIHSDLEALGVEAHTVISTSLNYIEEVSFGAVPTFGQFSREGKTETVLIDASTRRNLELTESALDGDRRNSLVYFLDHTKTAMGSRLFCDWLLGPSLDIGVIRSRQTAVKELTSDQQRLSQLRSHFVSIRDLDRVLSRISSGRANPRDLAILRDSIVGLGEIKKLTKTFESETLCSIYNNFDQLEDLKLLLESALLEEPAMKLNEGGIIKDGYHAQVDEQRQLRRDARKLLTDLENREKNKTGISALKVKYNNVFGYFIEVTKAHLAKVPEHFERKQTLVNAERFVTEELKQLEVAILSAKARQIDLEKELFVELRNEMAKAGVRIQQVARLISLLDVFCSLAHVALEYNYVCPEINQGTEIVIKSGRHPVVEQVIGQHNFVANDVFLNTKERRFAVLSGPNMGGKSTYLRQVGLIQLLAQIGSFVPVEKATLGVVDRIFTRIGASDDLARGDSTFMVEMREASSIVRKGTERSLVLIDEIGRGTATQDGLAIATAIADWLHHRIKCRTIFATHFHELNSVFSDSKGNKDHGGFCISVGIVEEDKDINFTHRIEEKPADRSYGIEVARLAGLPEELLLKAEIVLAHLIEDSGNALVLPEQSVDVFQQKKLEKIEKELTKATDLISQFETLQLEQLTPLQALVELARLQELAKSKKVD